MSRTDPIPLPAELAERIRACRDELAALRRLHRIALALRAADDARSRRAAGTANPESEEKARGKESHHDQP